MSAKLSSQSTTDSGSMKNLKLEFHKGRVKFSSGKKMAISQTIQILEQLCDQCARSIPALVLAPAQEAVEELSMIKKKLAEANVTRRENIVVIHADKVRTFGKRFVMEKRPDGQGISLVVTGSKRLHDLFVDIDQSGHALLSYKGLSRQTTTATEERIIEAQLSIVPLGEFDSMYTFYHASSSLPPIDYLENPNEYEETLSKMELDISRLSLSPELHVLKSSITNYDSGKVHRITAREFKKLFGVKLLKTPVALEKGYKDDLDNINDSYRKLYSFLDRGDNCYKQQISYDEGVRRGDLRHVSRESILAKILNQFHTRKDGLPKVVVVKINDLVGYGLVAGEFISAGTIIGEYSGIVVRITQTIATSNSRDNKRKHDNTYFAPYSLDAIPGSEKFVIDAKRQGNLTRFINHSAENPNASWTSIFDGDKFRLIIAATRHIMEGKQILLKYNNSYWSNMQIPAPIPL